MNITYRATIAVIAIVGLQFCAYAQNGREAFQEIGASYGAVLNPHNAPVAIAAYGFGSGRNTVSLQAGRSQFGSCGVGLENFDCDRQGSGYVSVSGYQLTDFSVNYQRDLYHPPQSRVTIYGGMGLGYFHSRFTETNTCEFICLPPTPYVTQQRASINSAGFGVNGGFRVPVWKGIGVRTGLEAWLVTGNAGTGGTSPMTNNDTLVRATFGLYYRHNW